MGYHAGVQHESNGPTFPESRSLNLFYLRPIVNFGTLDGWNLILAPKLFLYLAQITDNPEIERYRGYAEWAAVLGKNDHLSLLVIGRAGSRFDRGSVEMNLTFPFRTRKPDFASFFLVQWFEGYGEGLLDYDRRSSAVRGGIALVR